jgi:hypothetical protein
MLLWSVTCHGRQFLVGADTYEEAVIKAEEYCNNGE